MGCHYLHFLSQWKGIDFFKFYTSSKWAVGLPEKPPLHHFRTMGKWKLASVQESKSKRDNQIKRCPKAPWFLKLDLSWESFTQNLNWQVSDGGESHFGGRGLSPGSFLPLQTPGGVTTVCWHANVSSTSLQLLRFHHLSQDMFITHSFGPKISVGTRHPGGVMNPPAAYLVVPCFR